MVLVVALRLIYGLLHQVIKRPFLPGIHYRLIAKIPANHLRYKARPRYQTLLGNHKNY